MRTNGSVTVTIALRDRCVTITAEFDSIENERAWNFDFPRSRICGRKTLTRGPEQAAETVLPFFCSLSKSLEHFDLPGMLM